MGAHGEWYLWTFLGKECVSHPVSNETLYFHTGLRHLVLFMSLSLPLPTHSSVLEATEEEMVTHFFKITNEPPLWTAGLCSL